MRINLLIAALLVVGALAPGRVMATHDPNDFFVTEAAFPGVFWEAVWGTSPTDVWAVGGGGGGTIAHRDVSGWSIVATFPGGRPFDDVWAATPTKAFATIRDDTIRIDTPACSDSYYEWDGVAWTAKTTLAATFDCISSVTGISAGNFLLGGWGQSDVATLKDPRVAQWNGATFLETVCVGNSGSTVKTLSVANTFYGVSFGPFDAATIGRGPIRTPIQSVNLPGDTCGGGTSTGPNIRASFMPITSLTFADLFNVGAGGGIYRGDMLVPSVITSPTALDLEGIHGTSLSNIWAVGNDGTIIHWDGSAFTLEPSTTAENFADVWCADATNCWAVSGATDGVIQKLQINPVVPAPSLVGFDYNHDNIFISASQAQCLSDETSFSVNLEPPGAGLIGTLTGYILNSDTGIVVETIPQATFFNLGGKYFHTSRVYPPGDYQFLVTADFTLLPDAFMGVAFNVPQGTCFTPAQAAAIENRFDLLEENLTALIEGIDLLVNITVNETLLQFLLTQTQAPIAEAIMFSLALLAVAALIWWGEFTKVFWLHIIAALALASLVLTVEDFGFMRLLLLGAALFALARAYMLREDSKDEI